MSADKKQFYAIKVGNNVENLIVNTWNDCQKYVIGYPAVYKKFKTESLAQEWLDSLADSDVKNILIRNDIHRFHRLKRRLEEEYNFEIPDYITDEIINNDDYANLCALINLAVMNDRISKQNAETLKKGELKKYRR